MWYGNMFKQCDSNISILHFFLFSSHVAFTTRAVSVSIPIYIQWYGHTDSPGCRCILCGKLKSVKDKFIGRMGTMHQHHGLNTQEEIISRSRCIFLDMQQQITLISLLDKSTIYCQTLCYSVPIFHLGIVRWIYQALYTVSVQLLRRDQGNRNPTYYHTNK